MTLFCSASGFIPIGFVFVSNAIQIAIWYTESRFYADPIQMGWHSTPNIAVLHADLLAVAVAFEYFIHSAFARGQLIWTLNAMNFIQLEAVLRMKKGNNLGTFGLFEIFDILYSWWQKKERNIDDEWWQTRID